MPALEPSLQSPIIVVLVVLVLLLTAWNVILERRLRRIQSRYREILRGPTGAPLEELLRDYTTEVARSRGRVEELVRQGQETQRALRRSLQGVGVVRFNPFSDTGGDQSFAIALLDPQGDGVVFTGLHGRAEGRVYAKPVLRGGSSYPLSEEEKRAIAKAQERIGTATATAREPEVSRA